MKRFDILEIPIRVTNNLQVFPYKSKKHYELRIGSKISNKKAISDQVCESRKFILISDDKILGKSNSFYTFSTPIDFVIPQNDTFYENFACHLLNDDFNTKIKGNFRKENFKFEPFAPPILSLDKTFENYDFKNLKNERIRKAKTVGNKILNESQKIQLEQSLLSEHGESEFKKIFDLIEKQFNKEKITRMKKIRQELQDLPFEKAKKYFPLFAIFRTHGPWRKSWIQIGYEPESNIENYKKQKITLNRKGKEICIEDYPFLIYQFEQNRFTFLRETANEDGFITDEGYDFINLHFDRSIIVDPQSALQYLQNNSDEASDFSLLDE